MVKMRKVVALKIELVKVVMKEVIHKVAKLPIHKTMERPRIPRLRMSNLKKKRWIKSNSRKSRNKKRTTQL